MESIFTRVIYFVRDGINFKMFMFDDNNNNNNNNNKEVEE